MLQYCAIHSMHTQAHRNMHLFKQERKKKEKTECFLVYLYQDASSSPSPSHTLASTDAQTHTFIFVVQQDRKESLKILQTFPSFSGPYNE